MTREQRLTLLAAILGSAIVLLDGSIVNVALPAIERDLRGGLPAQQWVANSYLLALGSLILIGGSLGDIYGQRRMFTTGVAAFGVFSLACAVAPTVDLLIVARAFQGAAGALVAPSSLAIIVAAFAPEERGRAVGSWTAWSGVALILGPLVGGAIVNWISWRWIFVVNVPLVVATLATVLNAVPPRQGSSARCVDLLGAGLCTFGFAGFVFALVEEPRHGWGSPTIAAPFAVGVLLIAAFLGYERRVAEPMLPVELFARRNFTVANAETFAVYAGLAILFFFLIIYLQQVAGYSALKSSLTTLPASIVMFAFSRRAGMLADRFGPRLFMAAGPLIAAAGIFLLDRVNTHVAYFTGLLPALVIFAIGQTLTVAPLTATVFAGADRADAGIASAINNAVARMAGLIGVSVAGAVISSTLLGETFAPNQRSVRAFHEVIVFCAALFAAGGVTAAIGIANPRRTVDAKSCAGGQLVGAPQPATQYEP